MPGESIGANLRSSLEFVELCDVLLAQGQVVRFTAEGWSMYPAIRDGEVVDLAPVDVQTIRRGDVLLCRLGPGAVAHRVIGIDRTTRPIGILLRGDAAFDSDAPLTEEDVLGQVIATTRSGVRRRLDTPTARLVGPVVARAWRAKRWLRERLNGRR
jgi:signal peptidase I